MLKSHKRAGMLAALTALVLTGCGSNAGSDGADGLTVVRYGSVGGLTDAPFYVAEELGYFEDAGIKLERNRMAAGPNIAQALGTGDIDVGAIAAGPALFNALASGIEMRMVADRQSNQGDRGFGISFVISSTLAKEVGDLSDERSVADALKGKKIAVSAKSSAVHLAAINVLEHYGLTAADAEFVEVPYSSQVAAFSNNSIQASWLLEPFLSQALEAGVVAELDIDDVGYGLGPSLVPLVYGEDFANQTELARNFMLAYLRGAAVVNDAWTGSENDQERILGIIADKAETPVEEVRKMEPPGTDPWAPIDITLIEKLQEFGVEQGAVEEPHDVKSAVDDSFAEWARGQMQELDVPGAP